LKEKKQVSSPCTKKGLGSSSSSSYCECYTDCKNLGGYSKFNSIGTLKYNIEENKNFIGCTDVDEFLIENNLIRYYQRETTGLEVLFSGIERMPNIYINSEKFDLLNILNDHKHIHENAEFLDNESSGEDSLLFNVGIDSDLFSTGLENDIGIMFMTDKPGLSQSFSNDIFATRPTNLIDSFFKTLYSKGLFSPKFVKIEGETLREKRKREQKENDLFTVASCLLSRIDSGLEMKKIWPRYTKIRFLKFKEKIYKMIDKNLPKWAQKFNRIWEKLTEAQAEVILEEWFYEELEKPTQKESASKLGITISSYQDRLEGAYKKFEKLYPEFTRQKRKMKIEETELIIYPLYETRGGEKNEIPIPKRDSKNKPKNRANISELELFKIQKWAIETTESKLGIRANYAYDEIDSIEQNLV